MGGDQGKLSGPNLSAGIGEEALGADATLLGHAGGEAVLLVRRGGDVLAVGATCTHYGGPLAEGVVVGDTIRCRGTTGASICERARPSADRRSIPSPASRSRAMAAAFAWAPASRT